MTEVALVLTLTILSGLALMQVLLIGGLPLGDYGWGGQHRVLPPRLRVAAAVAILLYAGFAALVLRGRANRAWRRPPRRGGP